LVAYASLQDQQRLGVICLSNLLGVKTKKWIGHRLRKASNSITRRVLQWNPQGQRRVKPKNAWRRGVEQEMKEAHLTWDTMETTA